MKRLHRIIIALILAATATAAQADAIGRATNKAGGTMTLTDILCPDSKTSYIVYSTGKHGENALFGCWVLNRPDVVIEWTNGDVSAFPAVMFEAVESARKPAGRGM